LPDWLAPYGHYSLHCRKQACERIASGDSAEQAAPHCKDPTRLPDLSTVRRWVQRHLLSVWCWVRAGAQGAHFLQTPTILAWDLTAAAVEPQPRWFHDRVRRVDLKAVSILELTIDPDRGAGEALAKLADLRLG
jgi:hypothetical protein